MGLWNRIANASPASVAGAVAGAIASRAKQEVIEDLAREVGAKKATLDAITDRLSQAAEDATLPAINGNPQPAEAKAYDQLGVTEASSLLGTATNQPKENREILSRLYETHPAVFVCTNYIASSLASIPLRALRAIGYEDGEEIVESADDHPVAAMLRYINPAQSPFDFVESLASWLILTGEAFIAYVEPSRTPGSPAGLPAEMWILNTPFVEKIISPATGMVGLTYNVGGEVAYFDARDIVHFKTWSPVGRWRGQGVPVATIKTLQTDIELRQFNQRVLQQGVHISGVLETDNEDLNRQQARVIRKSFEAEYSGTSKAAKVAVLWGGLKFNPTSILQKDIMMPEQKTGNRDEIFMTFGLKPELLTEKFANKATAETVRRMAYEDVILGRWGMRIVSTLNATGLARFAPDIRVTFDSRNVSALQTSLNEKLDAGEKAIRSGQMTPNEVRQQIHGLPPLGEELDIPMIAGKPIDQIIAGEAAGNIGGDAPNPGNAEGENARAQRGKSGVVHLLTTRDVVAVHSREMSGTESKVDTEFRIAFEARRSLAEKRLQRAILSVYRDLRKEVRPMVSRSTTFAEVMTRLEQVYLIEGRDEASTQIKELLRREIDGSVEWEMARLGIRGAFDVKPIRALRRLDNQKQRIRNMWGKDWVSLRRKVGDGLSAGEGERGLTKVVDDFFDGRRNNALTIARTETLPAINGAVNDVALQAVKNNIPLVGIWVTNKDEKVRQPPRDSKNHAAAEGLTIIPGQEMFVVSGQRLEFPGDSWNGASADNTINCRCGVRNEVRNVVEGDNRRVVQ